MLKQIDVADLRPGMFVVDGNAVASKDPGLYRGDEGIVGEEMVQHLKELGYKTFFIDLSRSESSAFTSEMTRAGDLEQSRPAGTVEFGVSMEEEIPAALKLHDQCVAYSRMFMNDIREGKLDLSPAREILEGFLDSMERNADTLLTLSRLRQIDKYLYRHSVNVCILSMHCARNDGKSREEIILAGFAGLFHDLGKALVPPYILNAPRELTAEEFAIMKKHPRLGFDRLFPMPDMNPDVLNAVLHHHERHNGSGYPDGLAGDEISELSRTVALSDIYDALSSRRPYKGAMFPHKTLGIMYSMQNKELRYEDVALFIRMLGIYPVGSIVLLQSGHVGVVSASNSEQASKPVVTLVRDPEGREIPHRVEDLAAGSRFAIAKCLPTEATGIHPDKVLGLPVF
ncbi:HD-GYP domain-containing protein [Desulfovibrio sp. OttesenSCG-928-A18]|nr:HD-GYP domain-containing protein [Desulfovibrio sp. OttesenSCG-928-A18]